MRHSAFKFNNLIGSIYTGGNVLFSSESTLFSAVGNRVRLFDVDAETTTTLPFEARSDICVIAVSPDERLLVAIDSLGYSTLVNVPRRVVLHGYNFKEPVSAAVFSPNGRYLAVAVGQRTEIWEMPLLAAPPTDAPAEHLLMTDATPMRPLHVHKGHSSPVSCLSWSSCGRLLLSGAVDGRVRLFALHPPPGFQPLVFVAHRAAVRGAWFGPDAEEIYSVAANGQVLVWRRGIYLGDGEVTVGVAPGVAAAGGDDVRAGAPMILRGTAGAATDEWAGAGAGTGADAGDWTTTLGDIDVLPAPPLMGGIGATVGRGSYAYHLVERYYTDQTNQRGASAQITAAAFAGQRRGVAEDPSLLLLGFSNGVFSLHTMAETVGVPRFSLVHALSLGADQISTAALSPAGARLGLACKGRGALTVWDWQAEAYLLRQRGHLGEAAALAYSPCGQWVASGGQDGRVKVWSTLSGLCAVTFTDHTGPVTGLTFLPPSATGVGAVISSSTDGTLRAYDLARFRCFRTMAHPAAAPFSCVAVDPQGAVVVAGVGAGASDYDICVFNFRTGELADMLAGHAAPVAALAFSAGGQLASAAWDGACRVWEMFATGGPQTHEVQIGSEVTAMAYRPDGKEYVVATVAGSMVFVSADTNTVVDSRSIGGDIDPGRTSDSTRTAKTTEHGRCFTCLAYSPDSALLIAGSDSRNLCIYGADGRRPLLRRIQLSHSRSLDGILTEMNSKEILTGGVRETDAQLEGIDFDQEREQRRAERASLPGVRGGNLSDRRVRRAIVARAVAFSAGGDEFAVATPEGVLIFSSSSAGPRFDPLALEPELTPARAAELVAEGRTAPALAMSLRLGVLPVARQALLRATDTTAARQLGDAELRRLCELLAAESLGSPYTLVYLAWARAAVRAVTMRGARGLRGEAAGLHRAYAALARDLGAMADDAAHTADAVSELAVLPTAAEFIRLQADRAAAVGAGAPTVKATLAED